MTPITHLKPPGLPDNPAFAQGVSVRLPAQLVYVGGQNGVGSDGQIVDGGTHGQMTQALLNVESVLVEAGAGLTDVAHWRVAVTGEASLPECFAAFQELWAGRGAPPAISVDVVSGLANPGFLVEITAVAAT